MRILVYPHAMEVGGSQLNAIQLAGAVRDLGHDVLVTSKPGPLVERVSAMRLEHTEIPSERRQPSPVTAHHLIDLVRQRKIDIVHGYEWSPVVDACFGPWLRCHTAVVGTILSMSVVPFFPRTVPLIVGTELIRDAALSAGHRRVDVIEPPVDTDTDSPSFDAGDFRARYRVCSDEVLVTIACRLVPQLKLEGLLTSCDAAGELAQCGHRVRLLIVGDGPARGVVEERAAIANATAQREVVSLTGELSDPRPAYAAADVVVGQGGSALRGMSFGKPLVVVGERGFSELLTPKSAPLFLRQGWYGVGPGSHGSGLPALRSHLASLVVSSELRSDLGAFARGLVVDRFDLRRAALSLEAQYADALEQPVPRQSPAIIDLARCGTGVFASKLRRRYHRWRGTAAVDDANAQPVTEQTVRIRPAV